MFKKALFLYILLLNHTGQAYIIVSMTIPKCGTGLINNVIKKITNIKGGPYIWPDLSENYFTDKNFSLSRFYGGHIWPTEKVLDYFSKSKFRGFILIRDPRDQVLSAIDYILRGGFKGRFNLGLSYSKLFEQLIVNPGKNGINDLFFYSSYITANLEKRYRVFIDSYGQLPNFCLIHFEDLVGKAGGGSDEVQLETIKRIAQHLDIQFSDQECLEIMNNIFGNSQTFNKGKIGRWKTEFTPEMKELFKQHFNSEYLIELGYETSLDW